MKASAWSRCGMGVLALALSMISCSRLPVIRPASPASAPGILERCSQPFPKTPYRFIHAILAVLPGGSSGTLMGVTVVDPHSEAIESAILTLEGFVLFDARLDHGMHVDRAVPPFDNPRFASNLIEDVRLMYLAPRSAPAEAGTLEDGSAVCRYREGSGAILDIAVHPDGTWEIGKFTASEERIRRIRATGLRDGIPGEIELNGYAAWDYTLRMKLIDAEPAAAGDAARPPVSVPEDE